MKKFDNLKMTLFDSTKASFKLMVEAQFTRGNKEQGYRDLVYVTDRYTGLLNPNIYLTLGYKDETVNPVYTSYPQLFRLREAFGKIKDLVADNSGFINIDGQIAVRPDCQEPVVLANIGKNNNWISMKLSVIESEENGIINSEPGVTIELSTANRMVSALSVDEFLTVYTIINDLNLSNIQCMMSLAFLDADRGQQGQYQQGYQQPYYQQPQQYQQGYQQPYYQQPQQYQQGYQQQAPRANNGYPKPQYNNQQSYPRRSAPQQPVQQQPAPGTSESEAATFMRPQQPVQRYNSQPQMPTREASKPVMSLNAVEATEISEISYSDEASLDDIFNN